VGYSVGCPRSLEIVAYLMQTMFYDSPRFSTWATGVASCVFSADHVYYDGPRFSWHCSGNLFIIYSGSVRSLSKSGKIAKSIYHGKTLSEMCHVYTWGDFK
jgi:hypothetical protein